MKRRLFIILLSLMLLTGCSSDQRSFSFDISSAPKNLDPLFAQSDSENLILDNTMEGLFSFNEKGDIVPAGALTISTDPTQRVYTITLNPFAKWNNDQPVTAHDYVFAFRRMFDAAHPSSHAVEFYCISGGKETAEGKSVPLGVEAKDDYTLIFTLTEPNDHFTELLCSSYAVPCNEEFFNQTAGKYGLGKENCLFNGPFALTSTYDDVLYLSKNTSYHKADRVSLSKILLYIASPQDNPADRFKSKKTDAAFLTAAQINEMQVGNNHLLSSENTTWALTFGNNGSVKSPLLRKSLALATDPDIFMDDGTVSLTYATGLVPSSVTVGSISYRERTGAVLSGRDVATAANLLSQYRATEGITKLPSITVLCPDNKEIQDNLSEILQQWQKELQVYVNLKVVTATELSAALASGNYDMAITSFSPSYNSPLAVFAPFLSTGYYYHNTTFDQLVTMGAEASSTDDKLSYFQQAERLLIDDLPCLPVFSEKSFLLCRSNFDGLYTSPSFTRVFFKNIK